MCAWPQRRPGSLSTGAGGPMGVQRRPGSLSTGAGGPMGVLRIRGSVGSHGRVLYV